MHRGNWEGFQYMHREENSEGVHYKSWIQLKSAMYYFKRENHIMDLDGHKIIGTEDDKHHVWVKEAIGIWKPGMLYWRSQAANGGVILPSSIENNVTATALSKTTKSGKLKLSGMK